MDAVRLAELTIVFYFYYIFIAGSKYRYCWGTKIANERTGHRPTVNDFYSIGFLILSLIVRNRKKEKSDIKFCSKSTSFFGCDGF